MPGAEEHARILRAVAVLTVKEARAARQTALALPTEENVRAAFYACVLAQRTLLRASMEHPDEELAMIEQSMLMGEFALGLRIQLGRILEAADAARGG